MLLVVPLMILPGILVQKKLAQLAQEGMRESSIRNAILVEAVQGIEDIKLLRAESRFQNQWNHMNEVSADIGMRQRIWRRRSETKSCDPPFKNSCRRKNCDFGS